MGSTRGQRSLHHCNIFITMLSRASHLWYGPYSFCGKSSWTNKTFRLPPAQARVLISRSVPKALSEDLMKQFDQAVAMARKRRQTFFKVQVGSNGAGHDEHGSGSLYPVSISFDELVWKEIIQRGAVKIPAALVKVRCMDSDSLHNARLLRQGPGYQRTLFVLNPSGAPYLPNAQPKGTLGLTISWTSRQQTLRKWKSR